MSYKITISSRNNENSIEFDKIPSTNDEWNSLNEEIYFMLTSPESLQNEKFNQSINLTRKQKRIEEDKYGN